MLWKKKTVNRFLLIVLFSMLIIMMITKVIQKNEKNEIKYVIGVSYANLSESWQIALNDEIKEEILKHDDIRMISTNAQGSTYKQNKDFDNLIEFGVDLLITTVNDSAAIERCISKIHRKIPIILLNRSIAGFQYDMFIGPDDYEIGKKAGEKVLSILKNNSGIIAEVRGPFESPSAALRSKGFADVVKKRNNNCIFDFYTDWQKDDAKSKFYNFIKNNKINAVFAHDDTLVQGAVEGARMAGIDDIKYISAGSYFDKEISDNPNVITFTYPLGGKEAVRYALDILGGAEDVPKKIIFRSCENSLSKKRMNISGTNEDKLIKLGFIRSKDPNFIKNDDFELMRNLASKENIEILYKDIQYDSSEFDMNEKLIKEMQKRYIREFIKEKVDIIMFSPVVQSGWKDILNEADSAGIPVILFNEEIIDSDNWLLYIGYDFKDEGRIAAKWLVENVYNDTMNINVAEIIGYSQASSTKTRKEGFNNVINGYSRINVVESEFGDYSIKGGKNAMKKILENNNVNVVYAFNDAMAVGALEEVKESGLIPGKDIVIISTDGEENILKALKKAEISCIIKRKPLRSSLVVDIIKDLINKNQLPKKIMQGNDIIQVKRE